MAGVTAKLADFVAAMRFSDLPEPIVEITKDVLLDSIGCALGGYATERGKIAVELGQTFGANPEATVIGYKRLSCPAASFVNGELINCLDFDAVGPFGHVAPYVIPPALAIAEKVGATGKDLITAVALALEVGARAVGSVAHSYLPKEEPPYYEEAPRYSYNSTIFGAVAGACRMLQMSSEGIRSAFGTGGASTPVTGGLKWHHLEERSNFNLKYGTWSGWVAMLGLVAAVAAKKGFKGDPSILDGEYGYWRMYGSPFFKEDILVGDLGKKWYLEEIRLKYYPACYFDATPITAIERLVRENEIKPEEIDEIAVYGDPILQTPQRFPLDVKTNEDAQFCHTYLLAMAACHAGRPGPQWQLPSSLNDSTVRSLMTKVKVKAHPKTEQFKRQKAKEGGFLSFIDVIGEISARGKKFVVEMAAPRWSPSNPMKRPELADKFRQNAQYSLLSQSRVEQAIEAIWKLDSFGSVTELTKLLATNG